MSGRQASSEDPLFIVSPSLGPAGADGGKAFAERRVAQTTSLKDFAAFKTEPVTLDGLSGFETVADANDKATGRPMFIYQVILFDGESYYLMQGLAGRAQAAEHLPSFKEMARTFRRE